MEEEGREASGVAAFVGVDTLLHAEGEENTIQYTSAERSGY